MTMKQNIITYGKEKEYICFDTTSL